MGAQVCRVGGKECPEGGGKKKYGQNMNKLVCQSVEFGFYLGSNGKIYIAF